MTAAPAWAPSINESILVTQSQGGLDQGSYGGVGWLELGAFTISSTATSQVVLSNLATGNFVDADGCPARPAGRGTGPQCFGARHGRPELRGRRNSKSLFQKGGLEL